MPFGPIPVVGGAAGVAAFGQDQQAQQIQQQELLTRLIMQAQATQAQREWNQNYKEAQLASIQQARDEANANRVATRNENALKQIPGGQLIPSQLAGTPQAQDVSTPQMTLPASQLTGFSKIQGPDQSNAITGPTGGGATTGESQVQAAPVQPTGNLVKISSPEELNRAATLAETQSRDRATAAQRDITNALAQSRFNDTSAQGWQRIQDAMDRFTNRPPATVVIQTVDDSGKPVTRIVPKVAGAQYDKPVGATLEARLASAQAVNQTGEDIVRQMQDPKFAAQIGPAMGRYNSLRDFVGNAPPEFGQLAGEIESYSLANMGVHGMRSAQGAQKIADLMNQKQTPESLIAKIKGLNSFSYHFMENEAPGRLKAMGIPSPDTSTGNDIRVGGTYNGKKILSVEPVP